METDYEKLYNEAIKEDKRLANIIIQKEHEIAVRDKRIHHLLEINHKQKQLIDTQHQSLEELLYE